MQVVQPKCGAFIISATTLHQVLQSQPTGTLGCNPCFSNFCRSSATGHRARREVVAQKDVAGRVHEVNAIGERRVASASELSVRGPTTLAGNAPRPPLRTKANCVLAAFSASSSRSCASPVQSLPTGGGTLTRHHPNPPKGPAVHQLAGSVGQAQFPGQ